MTRMRLVCPGVPVGTPVTSTARSLGRANPVWRAAFCPSLQVSTSRRKRGLRTAVTPQLRDSLRRVRSLGVRARIAVRGFHLATPTAVVPNSVKARIMAASRLAAVRTAL